MIRSSSTRPLVPKSEHGLKVSIWYVTLLNWPLRSLYYPCWECGCSLGYGVYASVNPTIDVGFCLPKTSRMRGDYPQQLLPAQTKCKIRRVQKDKLTLCMSGDHRANLSVHPGICKHLPQHLSIYIICLSTYLSIWLSNLSICLWMEKHKGTFLFLLI